MLLLLVLFMQFLKLLGNASVHSYNQTVFPEIIYYLNQNVYFSTISLRYQILIHFSPISFFSEIFQVSTVVFLLWHRDFWIDPVSELKRFQK